MALAFRKPQPGQPSLASALSICARMPLRKNDEITAQIVRVVGPDQIQRGVVRIGEARLMAQQLNLDLVEICPDVFPPIVRIMDFSSISGDRGFRWDGTVDK